MHFYLNVKTATVILRAKKTPLQRRMMMVMVMMMITPMAMTVTVSVTITLGPGTVVSTSGPTSVFSRRCHPKATPFSYSFICYPHLHLRYVVAQ